jgi:tetratricopeptide (TPR) repeat protein
VSSATYDQVVSEYLFLHGTGKGEETSAHGLVARLEDFFWKRVEKVVDEALARAGDELAFGPADSLLIDAGMLDERLVARAAPDLRARLTAEINSPGERKVLYLSGWLSERFHSYLATRALPDERIGQSLLLKDHAEHDAELGKARQQRNELYRRVAPLFENLPGVSAELAAAIVRGAVDDRIEELLLASAFDARRPGGAEGGQAAQQAQRYDRTVLRALQLAREGNVGEENLVFLEALGRLRGAIFRKSLVRARRAQGALPGRDQLPAESRPAPEATAAEVRRFMRRELRLVRSLLHIGSQEGKVAQSCSVLLHDAPRTTRTGAAEVLRLLREVDPRLGLDHSLLIAPFTGSGFFEWDRDTLLVALSPARSSEEAVVNAVGNLRLLLAARQGQGKLIALYRDEHGASFREHFLNDYRAWVLRVGRGRREALSEARFQLLADHLGPPMGGPVVPAELCHLSVKEREDLAAKLAAAVAKGRPDAQEFQHLAVLHWQAERIDQAISMMEKAAAAAPESGQILYSLGALFRRRRLTGEARKSFRECARVALNSLWGIYANEALRRLA